MVARQWVDSATRNRPEEDKRIRDLPPWAVLNVARIGTSVRTLPAMRPLRVKVDRKESSAKKTPAQERVRMKRWMAISLDMETTKVMGEGGDGQPA